MGVVVLQERKLLEMFKVLRQFDGRSSVWRLAAAWLLSTLYYVSPVLVAACAVVVGVLLNANGTSAGRATLTVFTAALGLVALSARDALQKRFKANRPVAARLWTYEAPEPEWQLAVLLAPVDHKRAFAALRKAKLAPMDHQSVVLFDPPADAPTLSLRTVVQEPDVWRRSSSQVEMRDRILAVLSDAGVRARAGGIDSLPLRAG